jgi:phosphoribosyl 1,2-cyclic phosphate phosphodiesterase
VRITVLGSGTSHGVPFIGCRCAVCQSTDPRDQRTRPSILIDLGPRAGSPGGPERPALRDAVRYILVDTSTDFRQQALTRHVDRVDAILFTHSHADHICGLDDIRRYNEMQRTVIPCFGSADTLADLRRIFAYIFRPMQQGGGVPKIDLVPLGGAFSLGGAEIVPVPLLHGKLPVLGFRIGAFAYLTDCNHIPDSSWPLLDGVKTIILDALRHRPHSTHFSVGESVEIVAKLGAERAYFTHISHDLGHAETCARLPAGVELAYDGQVLEIPG